MVDHYRHASETPFQRPTFSGISIISPSHQLKKNVSVGHPLAKLSGSAHEPLTRHANCRKTFSFIMHGDSFEPIGKTLVAYNVS